MICIQLHATSCSGCAEKETALRQSLEGVAALHGDALGKIDGNQQDSNVECVTHACDNADTAVL